MAAYRPPEVDSNDIATWEYTERDKHFWPPDGLVPADAKLIVDLGCNVGYSTAFFAEAWPEAKVIGVDMIPECCEKSRKNCAEFGDRVEIYEQAIGYPPRTEVAIFNIASPVSRLRRYEISHTGHTTYPEVSVITLDNFLAKAGVYGQQIDYLKIDIEGAESEIIRDGGAWSEFTKACIIESHYDPRDVLDPIMYGLGFELTHNHMGQPVWFK
jgi:FkbM family methyltransferase